MLETRRTLSLCMYEYLTCTLIKLSNVG